MEPGNEIFGDLIAVGVVFGAKLARTSIGGCIYGLIISYFKPSVFSNVIGQAICKL